MDVFNLKLLLLIAFVPLALSKVWYSPLVFGNRLSPKTDASGNPESLNEVLMNGLRLYVYGLFASYLLCMIVIHQFGFFLLHFNELIVEGLPSTSIEGFSDFYNAYGPRHRSFGHGVIHGIEAGVMFGLFFLGSLCIFEKRSFKGMLVHFGFFVVSMGVMGGLVCAFL